MANEEKHVVYLAGVTRGVQDAIVSELSMPLGEFPFRFLGVPLSHKKLTISQCWPFVDAITREITHYKSRSFTFDVRLFEYALCYQC